MPINSRIRHIARQIGRLLIPVSRLWPALLAAVMLAPVAMLVAAQQVQQSPAAHTAGQLPIGNSESYALSDAFEVFEDVSARMSLEDVQRPAVQASFRPVKAGMTSTNFGLSRSAFWLRLTLHPAADAPASWLLEVAYPPLDQLELYVSAPSAVGGFSRQTGGDSQPYADRVVPHRNHVLPVTLQPGKPGTIYLRLGSSGTLAAPSRLWQAAALWRHDQLTYSALSLYFGLLIGLFAYNLLLFISLRDRAYLFYVIFVACIALSQAALTGLGTQFLWPQWPLWITVSISVGNAATGIFGISFAREFLSSRLTMPRLDRFLQVSVGCWLLTLAAALALPYVVSVWMITILAVIAVTTLVVAGIVSVRMAHPGAAYFLVAWAVLLLGVTVQALHNTGFLPSNPLTANSLMIGSGLEMVLLSFGLGNRISVAIAEKEQAQAKSVAEHAVVEALRESQEQYLAVLKERETILEASIVGIAFLTPDGRFHWANQAMLDIFGSHDAPITSMEPFYLSREEYLRVGGDVAACISRGEVYKTEIQVRQYGGNLIWISLSGKAVHQGDLSQGTVWVMMDITPRKTLEAELVRTSSEREAILNSALVGIVLSVARRHEWVNEKFAQMMGYPREELIGRSSVYIHPDLQTWESFGRVARATLIASGTFVDERQLKRRNGELLWVQMGGSCIRPNDPDSGVIWTFLDITQRKKSEQDTHEALEQQKELNELRSRFVAMTSHEFRTPLASILSAQELLKHYGERLPESEKSEILDSIAAGVQRMMRMLDRVLLIGKANAQMLEFVPRLVDVKHLCQDLLKEACGQQPKSNCRVSAAFAASLDECPEGLYDEKLLRHIFGNLLSNAIKYSPKGGDVLFEVTRADGQTVFVVSDQGIGIPADELAHLFESFHRASNVGAIQGTGLGLAIVKNAVTMHGGTIEVSSSPEQGTRFTVRLPDCVIA
jgi:PAS domain S-box-containing protein